MPKIFITRRIPEAGIQKLQAKGYEVVISPEDRVLRKEEVLEALQGQNYDAVLCLLTDKIDGDILDAAGKQCKIFANLAVGFDNVDLKAAEERRIAITNTPGVLTNTVAEHTFALMLAIAHRVCEADRFTRGGHYEGWAPMLLLGNDLSGKTIGIVGLGRIGSRVAYHAVKGFDAKVIYYDVARNEEFEKEYGAIYKANVEDVLHEADFVSIHVPLLDSTRHLMNAERFRMMKPTAYLVNTSRGPIVDEAALVKALKSGVIRGAALDVFENEPALASGLVECENVILTPHIASATEETRSAMAELAADNIIAALEGQAPPNLVKKK
ncbi:MAG: D-glycerate dehydrogenase [Candidatus Niyogibacteria bacterium]|nr:D-glycerate dehydrogenase [Candidatus Niyogibacteria bacterium]